MAVILITVFTLVFRFFLLTYAWMNTIEKTNFVWRLTLLIPTLFGANTSPLGNPPVTFMSKSNVLSGSSYHTEKIITRRKPTVTAMQRQTAVTAHLRRDQLLLFVFAIAEQEGPSNPQQTCWSQRPLIMVDMTARWRNTNKNSNVRLVQCWSSVCEADPALTQQWFND